MPKLGPFPSKEADFSSYAQAVVAYLMVHKDRLNILPETEVVLIQGLNRWMEIYPQSQNRSMRTMTIVQNKNDAKLQLIKVLRKIYGDMPQSILTAEDRITLNLRIPANTRTPYPIPTTTPVGQVNTKNRLEHIISFSDSEFMQSKPKGVRGCQIWCKVGEPISSFDELTYLATKTASPFVHKFEINKTGKNIHYWIRWENTRGETGPWGNVITATVTG